MSDSMAASGGPYAAPSGTLRARSVVHDRRLSLRHTLAGFPSGNLRLTPRRRNGVR